VNPDHYMYMEDGRGNLVHVKNVKPIDQLRDQLVMSIIKEGQKAEAAVAEFKLQAFQDIESFRTLSAERYGHVPGGNKGNVTLTSYNGKYRVVLARQDHPAFNEALNVAQSLIRECIDEWTAGSRDEVRLMIDHAFAPNAAGQVSVSKVMGLRQLDIDHPKWKTAMEAIADSVTVVATRTYIRIYRRRADGEYDLIPLDGTSAIADAVPKDLVAQPTEASEHLKDIVAKIQNDQAKERGVA